MRARRKPASGTVTVYPDGPLIVRGDVEIRTVDGTVVETGRTVALCRCGRSALKPLCDGSHKNARRASRVQGAEDGTEDAAGDATVARDVGELREASG